jgi:spore coat polysaccharide biosynthesis predicted glycosyltransferase SpsG
MYRVLLVCHVSANIGLGHLSRLLALAAALRKDGRAQPDFLIIGDPIEKKEFASFNTNFLPISDNLVTSVKNYVELHESEVVVFDLFPMKDFVIDLGDLFIWLSERNIRMVGVDSLLEHCDILDLIWVPSFYFDPSKYDNCRCTLKSGWDSFLIQKRLPNKVWKKGTSVLVLTGGGDVARLGHTLPTQIDTLLNEQSEIHWVRGPYAEAPSLPGKPRLNWNIHNAPSQLDELIVQSDYVLTVFGVSFFEVLQYGIPTVVFSPYGSKDNSELTALADERVAVVAEDAKTAILNLINLMKNDDLAKACSEKALEKLSINGAQQLSESICLMAVR